VQTNCDWNKVEPDILYSVKRRNMIKSLEESFIEFNICESKKILKMLLKFPIINHETIYVHYQYKNEYRSFSTSL